MENDRLGTGRTHQGKAKGGYVQVAKSWSRGCLLCSSPTPSPLGEQGLPFLLRMCVSNLWHSLVPDQGEREDTHPDNRTSRPQTILTFPPTTCFYLRSPTGKGCTDRCIPGYPALPRAKHQLCNSNDARSCSEHFPCKKFNHYSNWTNMRNPFRSQ